MDSSIIVLFCFLTISVTINLLKIVTDVFVNVFEKKATILVYD